MTGPIKTILYRIGVEYFKYAHTRPICLYWSHLKCMLMITDTHVNKYYWHALNYKVTSQYIPHCSIKTPVTTSSEDH